MSGKKDPGDGGEPSCVGDDCIPLHKITHPLRYYEFTEDEIKILEECDRESFYKRCVPFSAVFASLTYAGVKSGAMSRNRHFGPFPKIIAAIFVGYGLGRASYIRQCEKKLRCELPANSYLRTVMIDHTENRIKRQEEAERAAREAEEK